MKKITALLLSSVLLLTAIFVAIPLSAVADTAPQPIEAVPLVMDSVTNGDSATFTLADVTSATFTSVKGTKISLNSGKDFYSVDSNGRGKYAATFTPVANTTITPDETHFMFRYEANGPSSFCFKIVWAGSWLYLNSGATIEVLKDGATGWETISATTGTTPQIAFDEAFSGYIKFSYLANSILPSSSRAIEKMDFYTYGMGTVGENTYATEMTVGPFFTVTSDSASTVINVPDEFKPQPIEATPFVMSSVTNGDTAALTLSDAAPLSFTSVTGKRITLNSGKDFYYVDNDGRGKYSASFTPTAGTTVTSDETHFMFRFEANGPSSFCFRIDWSGSWLYLNSEATVEVLKDGETQWETETVTAGTRPQIQFDEAFSGYIKFSYLNNRILPSSEGEITNIHLYAYGMGTVGENTYATEMTVGPFFSVTSDSSSTEIKVPDEFKHQPIEAKPLALGTVSAGNLVTTTDSYVFSSAAQNGITFTLKSGKDFYSVNNEGRGSNGFRIDMDSSATVNQGDTYFMFRFESNGKVSFSPMLVVSGSWYNLKSGATVKVLKDGENQWETINTSATVKPQIQFDEAFSGYIKIAYTDFDSNGIPSNINRPMTRIDIYTYGMGTVEDNIYATEMSVGAFYSVSSDSFSNTINIETVNGDVNVDGLINTNDLNAVRNYMLRGVESKYLNEYGKLSNDEEVDILDLVKLSALV